MAGFDDASDPGEGPAYRGDISGGLNPILEYAIQQRSTPTGQLWAGLAAHRIQDFLTRRAVATEAKASADEFVTNLSKTKANLVDMVKGDPTSMDLALEIAGHSVRGLVDQHAHLSDEDRAGAANDLIGHFNNEIVHAGIQRWAEADKPTALQAINRYREHLSDDDAEALTQYAQVQENMRGMDAGVAQKQRAINLAQNGYDLATTYLHAMADPSTGQFRAVPNFYARLMQEDGLAKTTQMAIGAAYSKLSTYGESPSDPMAVANFISRIADNNQPTPSQGEILSHLGSELNVADGAWLNSLLAPSNPTRKADMDQLHGVVQTARDTIASVANGPAGENAFGRFMGWMTNGLRNGVNLNELMDTNPMQRFAPTIQDYRAVMPSAGPNDQLGALARRNMYSSPAAQGAASQSISDQDFQYSPQASASGTNTFTPEQPTGSIPAGSTPSEQNQIRNMEQGRGAASAGGEDETKSQEI